MLRIPGLLAAWFALASCAGPAEPPAGAKLGRPAVYFFVATDCPISNAYAPEVNRICAEYGGRGVEAYVVYPWVDAEGGPSGDAAGVDAPAEAGPDAVARSHAAEYGYPCEVITRGGLALARRLGATITPEAVLLSPDGRIAYRGRINDLYVRLGQRRYAPTTRELRDALDAALAGRPAPVPRAAAVGCPIPRG